MMSCLSGCIGSLGLIGCASLFEDGTYEIESDAPASVATYSNEKYVYNLINIKSNYALKGPIFLKISFYIIINN